MPIEASSGLSSRRMQQAGQDGGGVLPDVPGLGVGRDVDDHGGQAQHLPEQQLDQVGLAAAGGADEQGIGLGQELVALGPVQIDAPDAADVAVGHQGNGPPRLSLPPVPELVQPSENGPAATARAGRART